MNALINSVIGRQPPVTRCFICCSVALASLCSLEIISPYSLYLNWHLIISEGEIWRLLTAFLFFGNFSIPFFWNMYVLVFYCSSLEEMAFRSRTADFLYMLTVGAAMLLFISYWFANSFFISGAVIDLMTYVWGRRNSNTRLHFVFFTVRAVYLPWALAVISWLMKGEIQDHLMGIVVGHIYYFFEDVYPLMPTSKGFRLFKTPRLLCLICGQRD